jgi:hypothetical protein
MVTRPRLPPRLRACYPLATPTSSPLIQINLGVAEHAPGHQAGPPGCPPPSGCSQRQAAQQGQGQLHQDGGHGTLEDAAEVGDQPGRAAAVPGKRCTGTSVGASPSGEQVRPGEPGGRRQGGAKASQRDESAKAPLAEFPCVRFVSAQCLSDGNELLVRKRLPVSPCGSSLSCRWDTPSLPAPGTAEGPRPVQAFGELLPPFRRRIR